MAKGRRKATDMFGDRYGQALYQRYHSMKSKAKAGKLYFEWKTFDAFLTALLSLAPSGYHPKTHRMQFDLTVFEEGAPIGYCVRTMKIVHVGSGTGGKLLSTRMEVLLVGEILARLLTEEKEVNLDQLMLDMSDYSIAVESDPNWKQ